MPLIIAIPTCQKVQRHITGRALHWCLSMAVSASQTTCGAVSTDMHRLVMCSVWSGRWSRSVSSRCQLINECLPECLLVHGYLSFTFCDILVQQEGIHNGNVHNVYFGFRKTNFVCAYGSTRPDPLVKEVAEKGRTCVGIPPFFRCAS